MLRIQGELRAADTAQKSTPGLRAYVNTGAAWTGDNVNEQTALTISAVWRAVQLRATAVGTTPFILYRRGEGTKERARTSPLYRLMHDRPNPEMSACTFKETMQAHIDLYGNAYAEIEFNGASKPIAFWPIPPYWVSPFRKADKSLWYRVQVPEARPQTYELPASDMLHIPGLGFDGLQGYSVLSYARQSLGLALGQEKFVGSSFRTRAVPSGILTTDKSLTEEASDRMRMQWNKFYGGTDPEYRTAVLEEGTKFQQIAFNHEDMQLLQSRKFSVLEVARWFGVPPHMLYDLDRATFCLPAGETVLTESGPKPIETLQTGERVWSRDDRGRLVLSRVSRSGCTGIDPILTIRTSNRTLRCNAKHPILCRRRVLSARQGAKIGGTYIDGQLYSVRWETQYVPAGEVRAGDVVVTLAGLPDGGSLENCPTRLPSIGFMEFCGLLLGDGNLIGGRGSEHGTAYVTIARAAHASYMDYYREVIQQEFTKRGGESVTLQEGDRFTRFSSVEAVEELRRLGFSGTARTKSVPGWVWKLPVSHRLAFIRGFLDADGSCDKQGRLSFSSCNKALLGQIRDLCLSCGVPVTNLSTRSGVAKLPDGSRATFTQHYFTCSDPGANRRIGSRTPHYVARMEAGRPFGRKDRAYPRYGGDGFAESGFSLSRVVSVSVGVAEPVYDLEVEGTHSFIAEGVVVHNSNIEHQGLEFLKFSLLPSFVKWEQECKRKLLPDDDTLFFEFFPEALLRNDTLTRYRAYDIAIKGGWMTRNEARRAENMNDLPGADELMIPANMAPTDGDVADDDSNGNAVDQPGTSGATGDGRG